MKKIFSALLAVAICVCVFAANQVNVDSYTAENDDSLIMPLSSSDLPDPGEDNF